MNFKRTNFDSGSSRKSPLGIENLQKEMWLYLQKKSCESFLNERKCILVQDWLGPEGQKIYDSLDWFEGADDVLRLQTEVRDEVGESGKSRM